MKCPSCGRDVVSAGKFCPYCGRVMVEQPASPTVPLPPMGPTPPYTTPYQNQPAPPEYKGLELWARYFAHGALFSIMTFLAAILWIILTIPLVLCGAFIGFAIALVILVFIFGGINTVLNTWIWGRTMDQKWSSILVHGIVILLALLAVSIPSVVIQALLPHPVVAIVLFIAYCFIDGIVGKWVGGVWMKVPRRMVPPNVYGYPRQ